MNLNAGTYDPGATKWFNPSKKTQSQPGSGTNTPPHIHDANTGGGFSYGGGADDKQVNFNSGTYDKGATKWYTPLGGKKSPSGSEGTRTPPVAAGEEVPVPSEEGEGPHKKPTLGEKIKGVLIHLLL